MITRNRIELSEKQASTIWRQAFGAELISTENELLNVIYPGRVNGDNGPDFRDAVVLNRRRLTKGDVEVHVRSSDWYSHEHHTDGAYNNVILHVASLIFICFGYGFAKTLFPENVALLVGCACYLLDQMVFSVSMARSTYMQKIARQPDHIQPALTAGVTLDHIFSISAALVGGIIWSKYGFQYVFLFGMVIAVGNLAAAVQVEVPVAAKGSG